MRRSGTCKALLLVALLTAALFVVACSGGKTPTASITLTDDTFTLEDGVYTTTVASNVDTLDVLNYFEVSDGYTLKLYSDAACTQEIDGDPVFTYGVNTFYLRAEPTDKGTAVTVTVKITREQGYVITFMDGDTVVGTIHIDAGQLIGEGQVPAPAPKVGYTFGGWDGLNLTVAPTGNATYRAIWTANTDTPYKVEHYLQNADRTGYDLHETENLTGETDTTATATPKLTGDYATYEHNPTAAGSLLSGNIAGDGSLVLKVYYDKASAYTIIFMDGDTEVGRATVEVGEKVADGDIPTPAPKAGYTFGGWDGFNKDVAPTGNATYQAIWTPNSDTAYTVKHYRQKDTLDGYEEPEIESLKGTTDTVATAVVKDTTQGTYLGYTHNPDADGTLLSGNIEGDGSLVLSVYYDRIKYDIAFDFNTDTNIETDGARYEGITAVVLYGGQISFTVFVNEDYNQSNVKYKFTPTGGSAVDMAVQFNNDEKSYTYTYAPTASGTVSLEGAYQENKYAAQVNLNLTLFDPEWGTIASLDEVQIVVDGGDPYAYTEAVENKLSLTLAYGDHVVTVKDGERTTDFTLSVKPEGWDAKLATTVYSVDITMTVGYSRVEMQDADLKQNPNGTIGKTSTPNKAVTVLDGDKSGDFAARMRYTITAQPANWSYLEVHIGKLTLRLSAADVSVNADGTLIGNKFDNGATTTNGKTNHSKAGTLKLRRETATNDTEQNPYVIDFMVVRLYDDQIRLYYGNVNKDAQGGETEDWYYLGNITETAVNIGTATLPHSAEAIASVLTSMKPTIEFTYGTGMTVLYSHYGISNSFFYNKVILPESTDNGTVTGTSGRLKVGETITVTATPSAEMAVTSFTVKKNGGDPVAVEEAGFGSVSGEHDVARVFTYTPDNVHDTYEFDATFALSEYVTATFEANYPSWYKETDDVLTVTADSETPAVATAKGDGTFEVKLKRGSYSSVTVSSARFRVSATEENKEFGSVDVSGATNLTNGTAIKFEGIKMSNLPVAGYAEYTEDGFKISGATGNNASLYNNKYYTLADVDATEGFTIKYTMKTAAAGGNVWPVGGFFFQKGNTVYSLMVYPSQGAKGAVRINPVQNAYGEWKNLYSVMTSKSVDNALNVDAITVEIAYYHESFYIRINDDFAVRFGADLFTADRSCNAKAHIAGVDCPLYLSNLDNFLKPATNYAGITPSEYFAAGTRTLGFRACDTTCTFTGVEYGLGNTVAKALIDDMQSKGHAKNDNAEHGGLWSNYWN